MRSKIILAVILLLLASTAEAASGAKLRKSLRRDLCKAGKATCAWIGSREARASKPSRLAAVSATNPALYSSYLVRINSNYLSSKSRKNSVTEQMLAHTLLSDLLGGVGVYEFFYSTKGTYKFSSSEQLPLNELRSSGIFDFVEKGLPGTRAVTPFSPNDTLFGDTHQRNLFTIRAPYAWRAGTGLNILAMASFDSGVDIGHEDLRDNIWTNTAEIAGDGVDNDANGYIDDVYGINTIFTTGNPLPDDPSEDGDHGTHVIGIAGAKGNNRKGIAGVAWDVKIASVLMNSGVSGGDLIDLLLALEWVARQKKNYLETGRGGNIAVANLSVAFHKDNANQTLSCAAGQPGGLGEQIKLLRELLDICNQLGITIVVAAGNGQTGQAGKNIDSTGDSLLPQCDFPNLIAVSATDILGTQVISDSDYGINTVEIAAPGVNVAGPVRASTFPNDTPYRKYSGTSVASPQVAGTVALMMSVNPKLIPAEVKEILMQTAVKRPLVSNKVGSGVLDTEAAVKKSFLRLIPVGDMDLSGTLDFKDGKEFVQALFNPDQYEESFIFKPVEIADMNSDGIFDAGDLKAFIEKLDPKPIAGDANLDGVFNSSDLVQIFTLGKYEDEVPENASWHEGDWDGDKDFTTSDLVAAFTAGNYSE